MSEPAPPCPCCEAGIPKEGDFHISTSPVLVPIDIPGLYLKGLFGGLPMTPCTAAPAP